MVFTRILASLLLTAIGTSAQCWNFAYGPIDGSTCYSDPFSLSYLEVFVVDDHLDPNCHSGTNVTAYVTFTDVLEVVHVHEPVVKSFVFEDDTEATFPLSFPVAFSTIKDGSEVTVTVIASSPPALPTLTCEFSFTVEATAIALETVTTSQTLTLVSSSTISRFLPSGISMFGRAPAPWDPANRRSSAATTSTLVATDLQTSVPTAVSRTGKGPKTVTASRATRTVTSTITPADWTVTYLSITTRTATSTCLPFPGTAVWLGATADERGDNNAALLPRTVVTPPPGAIWYYPTCGQGGSAPAPLTFTVGVADVSTTATTATNTLVVYTSRTTAATTVLPAPTAYATAAGTTTTYTPPARVVTRWTFLNQATVAVGVYSTVAHTTLPLGSGTPKCITSGGGPYAAQVGPLGRCVG